MPAGLLRAAIHASCVLGALAAIPAAVRARVAEQGAEVVANTPAEFRAFIKDEMERFAVVIRDARMQLD